jgi:hypothetical protein
MANKFRGEVKLTAGEKEFTLVYDCNAVCALEQALNLSMTEFAQRTAAGRLGFTGARALLWAGMLQKHASTTLAKCGDIVDEVGIKQITETCWDGLKHVFPELEAGNAEAAVGTGTDS